jgi:hypothetical protein
LKNAELDLLLVQEAKDHDQRSHGHQTLHDRSEGADGGTGPPPKWKLVLTDKVIFSDRANDVSGLAEVRLAGVQLPALKKGQKRAEFQKGGQGSRAP